MTRTDCAKKEEEAETTFRNLRWPQGVVCVHCQCPTVYECRRHSGALRFRCKTCRKDFSITSGTLFAFHKMPLCEYLAAIAIFVNEVKGKSALALSHDLGTQYRSPYVLARKLREAMAFELRGTKMGGEGETVEVDGGYFGGYIEPANHQENRRDRRLAKNQNGKRQVNNWGQGMTPRPRFVILNGTNQTRERKSWPLILNRPVRASSLRTRRAKKEFTSTFYNLLRPARRGLNGRCNRSTLILRR